MKYNTEVYCVVCKKKFSAWKTHLFGPRLNIQCPYCGSLPRHRHLLLYLKLKTKLFVSHAKMLHVAPERCFWKMKTFKENPTLERITIDIDHTGITDLQMDVTDLKFENNTFNAIICYHVLEHVKDDRAALKELFRVLKPGGWMIVKSPVNRQTNRTQEDSGEMSKKEREIWFGQHNHLRQYGRDFKERIEQAGFNVEIEDFSKNFDEELRAYYGFFKHKFIYLCKKPRISIT
ncbi:MAG: methyltransferase domain-containing protein [bacterium]|nr:methyltransferase domain-containing protein [bacterium]